MVLQKQNTIVFKSSWPPNLLKLAIIIQYQNYYLGASFTSKDVKYGTQKLVVRISF